MVTNEEKKIFDKTLKNLSKAGLSKHIMLIGSWAEFIYEAANLVENYISAIRTRDIDFLVVNLRKPPNRTEFLTIMKDSGFDVTSNLVDEVTKFIAPDQSMEIEFLIHEIGAGQNKGYAVESLGFSVIGLRHLNILKDNPTMAEYQGQHVIIPKPEAYMLHKLVINEKRNENKKTKDINSVQLIADALLTHPESIEEIRRIWRTLTDKERISVKRTIDNPELYELQELFSSFILEQEIAAPQNPKRSSFSQRQREARRNEGRGGR